MELGNNMSGVSDVLASSRKKQGTSEVPVVSAPRPRWMQPAVSPVQTNDKATANRQYELANRASAMRRDVIEKDSMSSDVAVVRGPHRVSRIAEQTQSLCHGPTSAVVPLIAAFMRQNTSAALRDSHCQRAYRNMKSYGLPTYEQFVNYVARQKWAKRQNRGDAQ
jgi:hypothetical protein